MNCKLVSILKQFAKFVSKISIMFSQGQLIFAVCFFIAFVIVMVISYRKDLKMHRFFYKGNLKVLLGFIAFIVILFLIKIFFKR